MDTSNLSITRNGLYYDYNKLTKVYKTFLIIHNEHIGYIVGSKGKNIKRIEYKTKSKVLLKSGNEFSLGNSWFYIESCSLYDLMSAYNKICGIACNAEYKIYRNFKYAIYLKNHKYYNSIYNRISNLYNNYNYVSSDSKLNPIFIQDSLSYYPSSPDYSPPTQSFSLSSIN